MTGGPLESDHQVADWREIRDYEGLVSVGRSALAWEVLRRDPAYQASPSDVAVSAGDIHHLPLAAPELTARCGILFR